MENKYLSIITNFGCHWKCPYCIVKNNLTKDMKKTTVDSLLNLQSEIDSVQPSIISISGGGDPLYNYENNTEYYKKLFKILKDNNLPLEMHTSYLESAFDYSECIRVVYHVNNVSDLLKIKQHKNEIVRVVFVATGLMVKKDIDDIYNFVKISNVISELSFRQMVDKDYQTTFYNYNYLSKGHKAKKWYYIKQNDYNAYFVEDKIINTYRDFLQK